MITITMTGFCEGCRQLDLEILYPNDSDRQAPIAHCRHANVCTMWAEKLAKQKGENHEKEN